jgi:hypothetical protein
MLATLESRRMHYRVMEEAKGEFGVNEILASWYIR